MFSGHHATVKGTGEQPAMAVLIISNAMLLTTGPRLRQFVQRTYAQLATLELNQKADS